MKCPKCKNKGFVPTRDLKKPLQNMGNKQYYETFITRRYICGQCGYYFVTKEEWYRDVEISRQHNLLETSENDN